MQNFKLNNYFTKYDKVCVWGGSRNRKQVIIIYTCWTLKINLPLKSSQSEQEAWSKTYILTPLRKLVIEMLFSNHIYKMTHAHKFYLWCSLKDKIWQLLSNSVALIYQSRELLIKSAWLYSPRVGRNEQEKML